MNLKLENKRALVMGASAGIGRGIAETLIQEKAQVALCARNEKKLRSTAKEIGAALSVPCDLSDETSIDNLFTFIEHEWNGLDIIVFNTGGPDVGYFQELSLDTWKKNFEMQWVYILKGIQYVLPKMKLKKWGRILVIASVAAKEPVPRLTVSNALRAGLLGLVNSVSKEVGEYGITVNAILPGFIRTERLFDLHIPEAQLIKQVPVKRLGEPQEVGALAAFLSSERAAYITGQALVCDGGRLGGI